MINRRNDNRKESKKSEKKSESNTAGVAASRTAKNLVWYVNHCFKYFDNLNLK